jgi:hypothetical protein
MDLNLERKSKHFLSVQIEHTKSCNPKHYILNKLKYKVIDQSSRSKAVRSAF